ncbi:SPOR domain-containing protein [Salinicola rhizosphaerae]|uniref:SPOR domain-containing protein n=1 Tax=Salinicola rhizosphaerae TaxID=1443141 RepID=A0ABQ3E8K3_9GAMM|nr:SPOR domain-containing protein [Salinicola rhizosphaerae]GHB29601.1 hypothetical protein GCM10009038_30390 [Salinicola rhizosphaerae]
MKYGWRERIAGAVILVALGAIFLPMLFDDPEPRQQSPEPVMVIEQPVGGGEATQRIIESPQPPASVADNAGSDVPEPDTSSQLGSGGGFGGQASSQPPASDTASSGGGDRSARPEDNQAEEAQAEDNQRDDPIAELAQANTDSSRSRPAAAPVDAPSDASTDSAPQRTPASSDGGWVVQVGSFGQADNATRLTAKLKDQGFTAYAQPRDNNLTTVYVGPFSSSDAGEKARAELKDAANIQGLLIRKPGS